MVLNDIEKKKIEKAVSAFMERFRPTPHIRPELDYGYKISDQSIELFEIRPQWNNPKVRHESPFAKATFVRTKGKWKVFWMRADLKWHSYSPLPEVKEIEDFLAAVEKDEYHCFFG